MRAPSNAFSVDVEDYYQVAAFAGRVRFEEWGAFTPRVARNTFRLLELLERHGTKATFFVLGWVAERNPGLVEEIHDAGHEVACHGYSHTLIYTQTPEQFRAETRRAKQVLEEIIGREVIGYRAASFSIVARSRWALDVLADEGFRYDSSIYPVHHDRYGMRSAPPEPHRLITDGGQGLVEFPPSTFDLMGTRLPVGGGGYFRLYPYALTRAALRAQNSRGRRCMCYFHPWEIDPHQPRISAGPLSRFRHYVNLHRTERRLDRLLGDFRFAPVHTVLQQLELLPGTRRTDREAAA
jgi:polysaccharide deacetylase family protein (PEP-CTERM system associated)